MHALRQADSRIKAAIIGAGTIAITDKERSGQQSWPKVPMGYEALRVHKCFVEPVSRASIVNGHIQRCASLILINHTDSKQIFDFQAIWETRLAQSRCH